MFKKQSMQHFRATLHELLVTQSGKGKKQVHNLLANLEVVQEYILLSDEDESYFDVFIENNIIASLFGLLNQHATHKDVVMKIISTMASFITNMSKAIHVNYILSHATLNSFIEYEYDFSDEEIVDYYVNFLKSLTLRMDRVNIKLYFNQKLCHFPLIWQAARFYNHKSSIISTTVRYIFLQLLKIQEPYKPMKPGDVDIYTRYLTSFPFTALIANYMLHFKWLCIQLDGMLQDPDAGKKPKKLQDLNDQMERINDFLFFYSDLHEQCPFLRNILENTLLEYAIIPGIYTGIFVRKHNETLTMTLGLFMAVQLIKHLSGPLQEAIAFHLFSPNWKECYIKHVPMQPVWYSNVWTPKSYWQDHMAVLAERCESLFEEYRVQLPPAPERIIDSICNSMVEIAVRFGQSVLQQTQSRISNLDPLAILHLKGHTLEQDIAQLDSVLGDNPVMERTRQAMEQEIQAPLQENTFYSGWQQARNVTRENIEGFVGCMDESLFVVSLCLVEQVYLLMRNRLIDTCYVNNDDFRYKILATIIKMLSQEHHFKLRTFHKALSIIARMATDCTNFDYLRMRLIDLQIASTKRFKSMIQQQKTWDYIFAHFSNELAKQGPDAVTLALNDILPVDISSEVFQNRHPKEHEEEVRQEIIQFLSVARMSHTFGIIRELPDRLLPNIEAGKCYDLRPAPMLSYCDLQVGYVLAYLFNERYIGLADELFYVIEIQTMQQQWAKILHREQYNDLEDLKVEPNWGLIVNTRQGQTYKFKMQSEVQCSETFKKLQDKRNFRLQIEITAINSYLETMDKNIQY